MGNRISSSLSNSMNDRVISTKRITKNTKQNNIHISTHKLANNESAQSAVHIDDNDDYKIQNKHWEHKPIDDWTCQELQDWVKYLNISNDNKRKIVFAMNEMGINGMDFNCCNNGKQILQSFEKYHIDKQLANYLYVQLQNIRNKQNKDVSIGWKSKSVNIWSCKELQEWISSLDMIPKQSRNRIINGIQQTGIDGNDFISYRNGKEIADSFDGAKEAIGNLIYAQLQIENNISHKTQTVNINEDRMSIIWKSKNVNEWSCNDLQEWIYSLDIISIENKNKMIAGIKQWQLNGSDVISCQNGIDIAGLFEGIDTNIGGLIHFELMKVVYSGIPNKRIIIGTEKQERNDHQIYKINDNSS